MNEQIQNLKDKIWADEYWTKPNTDKLLPAQLNRFAELIVKECAKEIIRLNHNVASTEWEEGYEAGFQTASTIILKHFGVEE